VLYFCLLKNFVSLFLTFNWLYSPKSDWLTWLKRKGMTAHQLTAKKAERKKDRKVRHRWNCETKRKIGNGIYIGICNRDWDRKREIKETETQNRDFKKDKHNKMEWDRQKNMERTNKRGDTEKGRTERERENKGRVTLTLVYLILVCAWAPNQTVVALNQEQFD
jgi:hypothetical protein